MTERIEGYFADADAIHGGGGTDDQWLAGLRQEARRSLIRRLVMERIRHVGYHGAPGPVPGADLSDATDALPSGPPHAPGPRWRLELPRVLEALAIGVVVTVASTWLCMRWGLDKQKGAGR